MTQPTKETSVHTSVATATTDSLGALFVPIQTRTTERAIRVLGRRLDRQNILHRFNEEESEGPNPRKLYVLLVRIEDKDAAMACLNKTSRRSDDPEGKFSNFTPSPMWTLRRLALLLYGSALLAFSWWLSKFLEPDLLALIVVASIIISASILDGFGSRLAKRELANNLADDEEL